VERKVALKVNLSKKRKDPRRRSLKKDLRKLKRVNLSKNKRVNLNKSKRVDLSKKKKADLKVKERLLIPSNPLCKSLRRPPNRSERT